MAMIVFKCYIHNSYHFFLLNCIKVRDNTVVFCSECGTKNYKDVIFCTSCGKKIRIYSEPNNDSDHHSVNDTQQEKHTPAKAFVSLLFGVLAVVFIFIIPSPVISILFAIMGIIFGLVGMKEVNHEGKGMARIGIILSGLTLL